MVGLNLGPSVCEATILIPTKEASLVIYGWSLFIIIILKKSLVTIKMATKINDKCQWCIITHTNCSSLLSRWQRQHRGDCVLLLGSPLRIAGGPRRQLRQPGVPGATGAQRRAALRTVTLRKVAATPPCWQSVSRPAAARGKLGHAHWHTDVELAGALSSTLI